MPDPQSVNVLLSLPARGSNIGVWDTPNNGNFNSIDGRFGGVQTLSVSGSTTLTSPAGTASPGGGPTQAENMALVLSGVIAATATLTLPLPGSYIIKNNCTPITFPVVMRAAGTGNVVGLPNGRAVHVWNNGTNVEFANEPEVGSYLDLAVTTTPAWMQACTVKPYLVCDGSTYSTASYTTLGLVLGSTFGGNGASTFGTPDLRGRHRIPLDNQGGSAAGRVNATTGGAGVDGTVLGTSGGSQFLQTHSHAMSSQVATASYNLAGSFGAGGAQAVNGIGTTGFNHDVGLLVSTGIISAAGTGSSGNMSPFMISGMSFVKT